LNVLVFLTSVLTNSLKPSSYRLSTCDSSMCFVRPVCYYCISLFDENTQTPVVNVNSVCGNPVIANNRSSRWIA
jgi:hypothetical protein